MIRKITVALYLVAALFANATAMAQELLSKPSSYLSTASTNSTLVYGGGANLNFIVPINTTVTTYFLKLYNKATAPTCGTDTPFMRIPLPPGIAGLAINGAQFPLGIGYCLTGALADNDTTNAATGVVLNFGVVPQ